MVVETCQSPAPTRGETRRPGKKTHCHSSHQHPGTTQSCLHSPLGRRARCASQSPWSGRLRREQMGQRHVVPCQQWHCALARTLREASTNPHQHCHVRHRCLCFQSSAQPLGCDAAQPVVLAHRSCLRQQQQKPSHSPAHLAAAASCHERECKYEREFECGQQLAAARAVATCQQGERARALPTLEQLGKRLLAAVVSEKTQAPAGAAVCERDEL